MNGEIGLVGGFNAVRHTQGLPFGSGSDGDYCLEKASIDAMLQASRPHCTAGA